VSPTSELSPAEACAASLCWLARHRLQSIAGTDGGNRIAAKVESYWHARACRWCKIELPELLAKVEASNAALAGSDTLKAFQRMSREARTRAVKEAQEAPWYDELTRVG